MQVEVRVGLPGFGDHVMAATWASILRDNGIDVTIRLPENMQTLFDLPNATDERPVYVFDYKAKFAGGRGIFKQNQIKFKEQFKTDIYITRFAPPTIVEDYNGEPVDIVLCCTSSNYSVFRNWPHEDALRNKLAKNQFTFRNLVGCTYGPRTLGLIKHCKAFVVVETGLAHYAAEFAYKGLVLASGHAHIDFWSIYNYNYLSRIMPCQNCFLTGEKKSKCSYNIACMNDISVQEVMKELTHTIARNT